MATQPNTKAMHDAFKRASADIASLADWFECELEKFEDDDDATWASVNSLETTREHLIEVLADFSGVGQTEIKRSLDELHDAPDGPDSEMPAPGQRMPDGSFPERNCTM